MTSPRPRPLRLAFVADRFPPDVGGLARAVRRIAGGLAARGHAVDVFCVGGEEPGAAPWLEESGAAGLRVCRVGAQRREDDTGAQLFDLIVAAQRRARYDAIHGFYLVQAGFIAAYAGRYLGIRSLVGARGNDLDRAPFDPTARAGILRALDLADVVTAVSHDLARKARALQPQAQVEVVANGVDTGLFRPLARDERRRAALALEGRAIVGFSGELRVKKGLVPLVDALGRLSETRPLALLLAGGVRRDDEGLLALLRRRHPRLAVAALDWCEPAELPARYALMDVFVHPSLRDGLPNALLEAMACARPVVAAAAGGIPDALRDGEQGLLVEPGDAEALGAAIARLLDDREAARRLGAAARRRVASEFTLEREVSGYLRVYRPVGLGGSTLPAPPRID